MGRLILVLWLCVCVPRVAFAADEPDAETEERARALFVEGTRLYESGRYEEAVEAFRIAHTLSGRPLLLFNMASALERVGRWDEALEALETYMKTAPLDELESLDSRIQQIRVRIEERDAELAESVEPAMVQEEAVTGSRVSVLPVVLFGTSAAGLGVGTAFSLKALGARNAWKSDCADAAGATVCPESAISDWQRDNRSSAVADIGWGVGLSALGVGLVVTLGGSGSSDLRVGVNPNGLNVGGRW